MYFNKRHISGIEQVSHYVTNGLPYSYVDFTLLFCSIFAFSEGEKKNLLETFVASHLVMKWHQTAHIVKKSPRKTCIEKKKLKRHIWGIFQGKIQI